MTHGKTGLFVSELTDPLLYGPPSNEVRKAKKYGRRRRTFHRIVRCIYGPNICICNQNKYFVDENSMWNRLNWQMYAALEI